MKKIALLLAIFLLLGCLAGCAAKPNENDPIPTDNSAVENPEGTNEDSTEGTTGGAPAENSDGITSESMPVPGEFDGTQVENQCEADKHVMVATVSNEADCEHYGEIVHVCSVCGWSRIEVIEPKGHDYTPASCEFDAYCNNCHVVVEPATGHTTTNGLCENCGAWIEDQAGAPVEQPTEAPVEEPSETPTEEPVDSGEPVGK